MRLLQLLGRAAGKPPSYLLRRASIELARCTRARRLPRQLGALSAAALARETGAGSLTRLWEELQARGWFLTAHDGAALRELYRDRYAGEGQILRADAEQAMRHEVDLLGSGPTALGPRIDWHRDFKSGRRWAVRPAHLIKYAALEEGSDLKVPWELSRGEHLLTLARAWVVFNDARYRDELQAQLRSWLDANPVGWGVNWGCTMDVALRALAWAWALKLMGAHALEPTLREAVVLALYRHGWWIAANLENDDRHNNHYVADALGLVVCGALFASSQRGRQWLRTGSQILEREIDAQVLRDGVDSEGSVLYHGLVTEMFLVGERLLQWADAPASAAYLQRLSAMLEFVEAYLGPDGLAPNVGDGDNGRALPLGHLDRRDHRYLLATGSVCFNRPRWKARAQRFWEDSLWLLGPQRLAAFDALPAQPSPAGSRGFDAGGFYVLRAPDHYLFADLGPVGFFGRGGHGHNDCLSFEWHALGHPLLTDSGTYVYGASPGWRNRFRASAAHNTVVIDGEEINRFRGPLAMWDLHNDALPVPAQLRSTSDFDFLSGGHRGYRRLGVTEVRRSFQFSRRQADLRIRDEIAGCGVHRLQFFFHAALGARATLAQGAPQLDWPSGARVRITPRSSATIQWRLEQGWFSPSYGIRLPRPVWMASASVALPFCVVWSLTAEIANP
jgi:hypothetical protein